MDINQFLEGLDALFADNKVREAESYLMSGLSEATQAGDAGACLTILNELIGYYRASERHSDALNCSDQALQLCAAMGLSGTAPYATTLLNAATAYRAGGKVLEAVSFYEEVERIYQENLKPDDYRFASLYNNMSLAYQELCQYEMSLDMLEKALSIIRRIEGTETEQATTYTNMAMNYHLLKDSEKALSYLEHADEIYREGNLFDPHYGASLVLKGQVLSERGENEGALQAFEQALLIVETCFGQNETYEMIEQECRKVREKGE